MTGKGRTKNSEAPVFTITFAEDKPRPDNPYQVGGQRQQEGKSFRARFLGASFFHPTKTSFFSTVMVLNGWVERRQKWFQRLLTSTKQMKSVIILNMRIEKSYFKIQFFNRLFPFFYRSSWRRWQMSPLLVVSAGPDRLSSFSFTSSLCRAICYSAALHIE